MRGIIPEKYHVLNQVSLLEKLTVSVILVIKSTFSLSKQQVDSGSLVQFETTQCYSLVFERKIGLFFS